MRNKEMKYPESGRCLDEFVETYQRSSEFLEMCIFKRAGSDACSSGLASSDNPFPKCSMEYCYWLEGWTEEYNACISA